MDETDEWMGEGDKRKGRGMRGEHLERERGDNAEVQSAVKGKFMNASPGRQRKNKPERERESVVERLSEAVRQCGRESVVYWERAIAERQTYSRM